MLAQCFGAGEVDEAPVPTAPTPTAPTTPVEKPATKVFGLSLGWIALGTFVLLLVAIGVSVTVTFLTQDTLKSQLDKRAAATLSEAIQVRNLTDVVNTTVVYITGATGEPGPIGPQGVQGATGVGATGPQGPAGPKGDTGATGAGPQGPQGEKGDKGDTGPPGASIQGPQGPQGFQGIAGPVGPVGLKGLQGLQGPQGSQGPPGEKGDPGPPLTCGTPCESWVTDVWSTGTVSGGNYQIRRNDTAIPALSIDRVTGSVGVGTATPTAGLHIVRNASGGVNNPLGADQLQVSNRNDSAFGLRLGYYDVTTPASASYGVIQVLENGNPGVLVLNPSNQSRVLVGGSPTTALNDSRLEVLGTMRVNGTLQATDLTASSSVTASALNVTGTLTTQNLVTSTLENTGVMTSTGTVVAPNVTVGQTLTTHTLTTRTLELTNTTLVTTNLTATSYIATTGTASLGSVTTEFVQAGTINVSTLFVSALFLAGGFGNTYGRGALSLPLSIVANVSSIPGGQQYVYHRMGTIVSVYSSFTYSVTNAQATSSVLFTLPEAHLSGLPQGSILCKVGAAFCNSASSVSSTHSYTLTCNCPSVAGAATINWQLAVSYVTNLT